MEAARAKVKAAAAKKAAAAAAKAKLAAEQKKMMGAMEKKRYFEKQLEAAKTEDEKAEIAE